MDTDSATGMDLGTSTAPHGVTKGQQATNLFFLPFLLLFFFNISPAEAICLGRKVDKRLGRLPTSREQAALTRAN